MQKSCILIGAVLFFPSLYFQDAPAQSCAGIVRKDFTMAEETEPITLCLMRTGKDESNFETGVLEVQPSGEAFTTRERGHSYVSLRVGSYMMEHSRKNKGRQVKCLRPVETGIASILIHDAYKDRPGTLEGCIAPGFPGGEANWQNSAAAMDRLWELLGGWKKGKRVKLVVLTNVSYVDENQSRDNWKRLKPGSIHA